MLVTKEELEQYMNSESFKIFHEHKQQKVDKRYVLTVSDPAQAMQENEKQASEAENQTQAAQSNPSQTQAAPDKAAAQTQKAADSQMQERNKVIKPVARPAETAAPQQTAPTNQEPQNTLLAPHNPLKPQDSPDGEYLNATLDANGALRINDEPSAQKNATVVTTRRKTSRVTSAEPKDVIENRASFTVPAAQDKTPIDYDKHVQEAEVASALKENANRDFKKMERNVKSQNAAKTVSQPAAKPLSPTAVNQASAAPAQPLQPSAAVTQNPAPKATVTNAQPVAESRPEAASSETAKASIAEAANQHENIQQSSESEPEPEKLAEFSIEELGRNAKIAKAMLGASKENALIRADLSKIDLKPLKLRYLENGAKYELNFKDENTIRTIRTMIIGGDGAITIGFMGGDGMTAYPLSKGVTNEELQKQGIQWSYEPINIQKMVMELIPFCADISKINLFGLEFAQLTFKTIVLKKMP